MQRTFDFHLDGCYFGNIISDEASRKFHRHDEYEITYVFEGSMIRYFDSNEHSMVPHELLLVPSRVEHGYTYPSKRLCNLISVHFLPGFLGESGRTLLSNCFDSKPALYKDNTPGTFDCFARSLLECRDMEGPIQRLALQGRIVSLLTHAYKLRGIKPAAPGRAIDRRIGEILEYLEDEDHLRESVSLASLSRRFSFSKNYLNTRFREETGASLINYIRIRRLNLARRKIEAGVSAKEAAYAAGFNDYSAFYRAFKSCFGAAPTSPPEPAP